MSKTAVVTYKAITASESAYKSLCGLFCVYKPPEMDLATINKTLKGALVRDLNKLTQKPVESIVKIDEEKNLVYLDKDFADTKEGKSNVLISE